MLWFRVGLSSCYIICMTLRLVNVTAFNIYSSLCIRNVKSILLLEAKKPFNPKTDVDANV